MFSDLVIGQLILAATVKITLLKDTLWVSCGLSDSGCFLTLEILKLNLPDPAEWNRTLAVFRLVL